MNENKYFTKFYVFEFIFRDSKSIKFTLGANVALSVSLCAIWNLSGARKKTILDLVDLKTNDILLLTIYLLIRIFLKLGFLSYLYFVLLRITAVGFGKFVQFLSATWCRFYLVLRLLLCFNHVRIAPAWLLDPLGSIITDSRTYFVYFFIQFEATQIDYFILFKITVYSVLFLVRAQLLTLSINIILLLYLRFILI